MALMASDTRTRTIIGSFSLPCDEREGSRAVPKGAIVMRGSGAPAVLKQNLHGTIWLAYPRGRRVITIQTPRLRSDGASSWS